MVKLRGSGTLFGYCVRAFLCIFNGCNIYSMMNKCRGAILSIVNMLFIVGLLMFASTETIAQATKFESNGVRYEIIDGTSALRVIAKNPKYVGNITVPPTVIHGGVTYNVEVIGQKAFAGCVGLTHIDLPVGLQKIEELAFENCISLTEIDIPDGISEMYYPFDGCSNITEIALPSGKIIGLGYMINLKTITIGEDVTVLGHGIDETHFEDNYSTSPKTTIFRTYDIGGPNTTTIYYNAKNAVQDACYEGKAMGPNGTIYHFFYHGHPFMRCGKLKNIFIGESVQTIGDEMFYIYPKYNAHLNKVVIGSHVTSIGYAAFQEYGIDTVISYASIPPTTQTKLEPGKS